MLEKANLNASVWESKYWTARQRLDDYEQKDKLALRNRIENYDRLSQELVNMNNQMMEIIRWHVNPETAKVEKPTHDQFGNLLK